MLLGLLLSIFVLVISYVSYIPHHSIIWPYIHDPYILIFYIYNVYARIACTSTYTSIHILFILYIMYIISLYTTYPGVSIPLNSPRGSGLVLPEPGRQGGRGLGLGPRSTEVQLREFLSPVIWTMRPWTWERSRNGEMDTTICGRPPMVFSWNV